MMLLAKIEDRKTQTSRICLSLAKALHGNKSARAIVWNKSQVKEALSRFVEGTIVFV